MKRELVNRKDIDSVNFSIYEILTLDEKHQTTNNWDLDVSVVEQMTGWPVQAPLEAMIDPMTIRAYLND